MAHADDSKPWGPMDPNSQHQLWSRWTFTVYEGGRHAPFADVRHNAHRFVQQLFHRPVGRMKVEERCATIHGLPNHHYVITAEVDEVAAHDPQLVARVRTQFQQHFVARGWGPLATSTVHVRILAGDEQQGRPAKQLIVMPTGSLLTREELAIVREKSKKKGTV